MEIDQNRTNSNIGASEQFLNSPPTIGTPWRLFVFSVLLFAFALLVYFGLKVGYENYLKSRSASLDGSLTQLSNSISQEDQQKFIAIYSQIVNLQKALGSHFFTGNIFPFLEKNTLPQVYYSEAQFDSNNYKLQLTGQASSLQTLAEQISQFEGAPELSNAVLTSMNFNPGGNTSFTINLTFNPSYLSKPI